MTDQRDKVESKLQDLAAELDLLADKLRDMRARLDALNAMSEDFAKSLTGDEK